MILDFHSHIEWSYKEEKYKENEFFEDIKKNNIDLRIVSALKGRNIQNQNEYISKLVSKNPDKLIGSAIINPKDNDCLNEINRIVKDKNFKCIELDSLEHNYYPEEYKDVLFKVFEIVKKHELIVNVFTGWGPRTMPAQWAFYAEKFPEINFVLLHMGTTDFGYGTLKLLPRYKNVYFETSGMYELPILRKAFKSIDHERFLFGSHFPDKFTSCSINTFDLLKLSDKTKNKLFYENAINLLEIEEE